MADLALEINDRYCSVLSGLEAWFVGALKFWQPETIKINVKTSDIFKFSLHFMELYDAEEVTPYCMTMFANLINFSHTSGRHQIDLKGNRFLSFSIWLCLIGLFPAYSHLAFGQAAKNDGGWLESQPKFLPVDEAFRFSSEKLDGNRIKIIWDIPKGYYLYRHAFTFNIKDSEYSLLMDPTVSVEPMAGGKKKYDEWFGDVEVYYQQASAELAISDGSDSTQVEVGYQGCADKGLCYPPQKRVISAGFGDISNPESRDSLDRLISSEIGYAQLLLERNLFIAFILFFVGGLGLAFTPCVLPMVPILSTIIVGQADSISRKKSLLLSMSYVIGMASAYALIGGLVGFYGASLNLQGVLQSIPVLAVFSFLFLLLALSMFGLYDIRMPALIDNFIRTASTGLKKGQLAGVFLMGSASSLIVSPCITAPLAGALLYISTSGDAILGGAALFSLGLGMGVPLLVVGLGGGHFLPQSGRWMNEVKFIFGFSLLAVSIWLVERILPNVLGFLLWAILLLSLCFYLFYLVKKYNILPPLMSGTIMVGLTLYVSLFFSVNGYSGMSLIDTPKGQGQSSSSEGGIEGNHLSWIGVDDFGELSSVLDIAKKQEQLVALDFYADWCVSCKIIERDVFTDTAVSSKLAAFTLVRADVTSNDAGHKDLMDRFKIFGPPTILFFGPNGAELRRFRVMSEIDAPDLEARLDRILELLVRE